MAVSELMSDVDLVFPLLDTDLVGDPLTGGDTTVVVFPFEMDTLASTLTPSLELISAAARSSLPPISPSTLPFRLALSPR